MVRVICSNHQSLGAHPVVRIARFSSKWITSTLPVTRPESSRSARIHDQTSEIKREFTGPLCAHFLKGTIDFREGLSRCRRRRSVRDAKFLSAGPLRYPIEEPSTLGRECQDQKPYPIGANRLLKAAGQRPGCYLPDVR